jgi:phage I-like protein
MKHTPYAACTVALTSTGNTIQLLPAGEFRTTDTRPADVDAWRLDAESAAALIAASAAKGKLVIDYEHQSLSATKNGQPAPAAGWFKTLEWREGQGLFATDVEWTDKARQMIQSGEYRYLSPVIDYDKSTGTVLRLISAALTNTPALDGMEEVTALKRVTPEGGDKSTADVAALIRSSQEMLAALKAKTDEANQARAELAALRHQIDDQRLYALIDDALAGARLLPVHVDAALTLGRANFAALSALLDRPPLVPALLGMQTDALRRSGWNPDTPQRATLTAEERHVAALTGRTPQEFAALKTRFTAEETGYAD